MLFDIEGVEFVFYSFCIVDL